MSGISELLEKQKELKLWETIQSLSFWDQLTVMPPNAAGYRGEQNALLARTSHELVTSAQYEDKLLAAYESVANLEDDDPQKLQVQRIKEKFDRSKKLSSELVSSFAKAAVEGSAAWEKAKSESNPAIFLEKLDVLVKLAREKADAYGFEETPYNALIGDFEPQMSVNDFDGLFNPIKGPLIDLVQAAKSFSGSMEIEGDFPMAQQENLTQLLAQELGFGFENGAIMTSSHPFSITMGLDDFRITTRYDAGNPFPAFYATAHEIGHSLYERGLQKEHFGTPWGEAATAGVHESQSLFWENRVCRSSAFLENWHESITKPFSQMQDWSLDQLTRTVNQVRPGFIRVDADETTYCLHIIIRYEIEKDLFSGNLSISEVEDAWNQSYLKYLGLNVTDPKVGFLQDVHWSEGLFGYFPSYALGHILSAQFSEKMDRDLGGLEDCVKQKKYKTILSWLNENIHHSGGLYYAKDLIQNISGKSLSAEPFLDYLKEKQASIFGA